MSARPKLLDLFCCQGGAAMGYHRAGFDVTGVDINPQPRYPFAFVQGDAIEYVKAHGHKYDAIHASPPCQRYTPGARRWGSADRHPDLVEPTREALVASGRPYVIENVEGAPLLAPTLLCGVMFGLGVLRHRAFESNIPLSTPVHHRHERRIGEGYETVAGHPGGSSMRDGTRFGTASHWAAAMGIGWMTARGLAESIPPAYTEHVGRQLIEHVATVGASS